MADPTPDTAGENAEAPKKKSKMVPLLVLLVMGVGGYFAGTAVLAPRLLAGGTGPADSSATAAASGHEAEAEAGGHGAAAEGAGAERESHFMEIGNILVNPSDSRGMRFLMTTVAFEVEDAATRTMLRQREAQVRDVVISVLEQLTMDELTVPGSRDSIRVHLKTAVKEAFHLSSLNVFISQFVIN